ncbi:hypothetical protein BLOT_006816 [Blomia tropicalis]|nr:hypothetical protein BLOT_006816 [Blomia tropicalis]
MIAYMDYDCLFLLQLINVLLITISELALGSAVNLSTLNGNSNKSTTPSSHLSSSSSSSLGSPPIKFSVKSNSRSSTTTSTASSSAFMPNSTIQAFNDLSLQEFLLANSARIPVEMSSLLASYSYHPFNTDLDEYECSSSESSTSSSLVPSSGSQSNDSGEAANQTKRRNSNSVDDDDSSDELIDVVEDDEKPINLCTNQSPGFASLPLNRMPSEQQQHQLYQQMYNNSLITPPNSPNFYSNPLVYHPSQFNGSFGSRFNSKELSADITNPMLIEKDLKDNLVNAAAAAAAASTFPDLEQLYRTRSLFLSQMAQSDNHHHHNGTD